jgi:hypothetical protein
VEDQVRLGAVAAADLDELVGPRLGELGVAADLA